MEVAVFGASKGGQLIKTFIEEAGYEFAYFIDDYASGFKKRNEHNPDIPVISELYDNKTRYGLLKDFNMIKFIHPVSYVCKTAYIGKGSIIKPKAMIGNNVKIGKCCVIDSGVCIEHDTKIDDGIYISVGSNIGSSVRIGDFTLIGIGCNIQTGVKIGKNCVICSGCTILNNVPDGTTVKKRVEF